MNPSLGQKDTESLQTGEDGIDAGDFAAGLILAFEETSQIIENEISPLIKEGEYKIKQKLREIYGG